MPTLSASFGFLLALSTLIGGWLLFDGLRALLTGDYTTPSSGAHAGQLGPWAGLSCSASASIPAPPWSSSPTSWLASAAGLFLDQVWYRAALLASALLSLWYLPCGTLVALLVIGGLFLLR